MKNADGVRNLEKIVRLAGAQDMMVVVSAMGKTTNALERVVELLDANKEEQALTQWVDIIDFHVAIMKALGLQPGVDIRLQGEIPYDPNRSLDENYDQIVSLGEIMSTQIIAVYLLKQGLSVEWWNMPKLLRTDDTWREAIVDNATSAATIRAGWERKNRPQIVVAQGFIGGTADGRRTTLGREGSDYTAALLGNYLDAESVTIWKDVPGILNADPRLEPDTILIPELRYSDAVELSYSGAQIIHPKTIRPLENKRIPLYVKPFGDPEADGSCISAAVDHPVEVPVYIWRKNQILMTMRAKDFAFVLEESPTPTTCVADTVLGRHYLCMRGQHAFCARGAGGAEGTFSCLVQRPVVVAHHTRYYPGNFGACACRPHNHAQSDHPTHGASGDKKR